MKTAMIALLAMACSATLIAGTGGAGDPFQVGTPSPDAGASVLLLGMGLTAVGLLRRAFRR